MIYNATARIISDDDESAPVSVGVEQFVDRAWQVFGNEGLKLFVA